MKIVIKDSKGSNIVADMKRLKTVTKWKGIP